MTVEIFISHVNTCWETCHVNKTQHCRLDYSNPFPFFFPFNIEVLGFNFIQSFEKKNRFLVQRSKRYEFESRTGLAG